MTLQDILKLEQTQSEAQIQHTCVAWFRYTFPGHALLLQAIPNGGMRTGASRPTYTSSTRRVAMVLLL